MSDNRREVKGRSGQTRQVRSATTTKQSSGLDTTTLVGIGVVVLVIAVGVSLAMGLFDSNTSAANAIQETAAVEVEGEALPPFDSQNPAADVARGLPAPQASGQDFAGEDVELLADGEANIVVFLAHWCPHCQAELPLLVDEWSQADVPDNVNITAVITAQDPNQANYPPSDWMAREGWDYGVLLDDETNTVAGGYGLTSYPYVVVTDAAGNVVARTAGESGRDQIATLLEVATGAADVADVELGGDSSQATEGATEGTGATEESATE